MDFSNINLNSSNFDEINKDFSKINWHSVICGPIELFPKKFKDIVFNILQIHSKQFTNQDKKVNKYKNSFTKNRYVLNRKIRKYKKYLSTSCYSLSRREVLINRINKLSEKKKQSLLEQRISRENIAIQKIKSNSKYFFTYANKFKKVLSDPNILEDEAGNLVTDMKTIADMLQCQFRSVFSSPIDVSNYNSLVNKPTIIYPLSELIITNADVIKAIDEIKTTSSCSKQDIPARVFKECKSTLCVPLRLFWTKSFDCGQVPSDYKKQVIIPIHKKGSKTKAEHFRPISLTPHPVKIFERIFRDKLVFYFEANSFFSPSQHGFRRHHSCSTQLLSHTNSVLSNLVEGHDVDCVYIDYAKAFDKVDHKILIKKLELYGVPTKYVKWIENFLTDRTQTVFINGFSSFSTPVISGVPQGSVLGPPLFNVYVNDLPSVIKDATIFTFADDTKLISRISNQHDTESLQHNLDNVVNWSNDNNMHLNCNKFELVSHKVKVNLDNLACLKLLPFYSEFTAYKATDLEYIESSPFVRDLGIMVDEDLNWKTHLHLTSKKCKQLCSWIFSVFHTRDRLTMLTLFNSLVRSKLEFSCEIWDPHQIQGINIIEQVQRSFTNRITGMSSLNYWERLRNLNIMSLQRRRERTTIIHLWKIYNKIYPNSINMEFKENKRSGGIKALIKPLPRMRGRILTAFEGSFVIKSARLWNTLPPNLTRTTSLALFKHNLDKFLQTIPDRPPLPGYPHVCNNSIIQHRLCLS